MHLVHDATDTEYFAGKVTDSGGVYVVPAFVGLGSPYWDMYARGAILGITRGTCREHIIRATLESIAYQSADLLDAIRQDAGMDIQMLRVDGGAVQNNFLMQFQADILDIEVERPQITETTAMGAAYLAGLAVGYWESKERITELRKTDRIYHPDMDAETRQQARQGWEKAVQRAMRWEEC
jgi:glycerol kinase